MSNTLHSIALNLLSSVRITDLYFIGRTSFAINIYIALSNSRQGKKMNNRETWEVPPLQKNIYIKINKKYETAIVGLFRG